MHLIFPLILFAAFVLASYFTVTMFRKHEWKYIENRIFTVVCLSSAIWSFGFFGVFIQTIPEKAYIWRALGMFGTFGYLISAQSLICYLSGIKNRYRYTIQGFSSLGVILYFFVIQKEHVTYELSDFGMTYSFNQSIWNNLYIAYSVITALTMLYITIYMLFHSPSQRVKALGQKILSAEIVIIVGMLLDTIFPMIGMNAIPGSSMAQFVGLAVMYHTIIFANHSRINISNMSEFIYYSLTIPVLVYDSNQKLQILNDTAYSFLGVEKDTFDITGIQQLFQIEEDEVFEFETKSHEVDAICCHNQLYCSLSVNKIYDDYNDIIGYIIIVTDLSERMKSMQKLEAAMKDAEHANQAKSIFLANMSHEIRTPMNAIIGFSELVLTMNINEEVRRHVEDIKFSSHNLLAIINDILDFSKIESGKMELVNDSYFTANFLNDVFMIIAPQAEKKGLKFNVTIDESIPKVLYGDKIRLRSILINILNNGVKYTQSGSVSLEVSIKDQTAKTITLEFKVSDTGIGIRPEDLTHLFKNFERLDTKVHYGIEGSGLGLAIASEYISLMNGKIKVNSTYKKGSTFTIIVPQEIIVPAPIEKDYLNVNAKHNSGTISNMKIYGMHVLVTDDNLINLRVAQGILSHYGLTVDTASSGQEAIELCRSNEYALVFMDQMMPEMDGVEAMNQIRKISPHYALGGVSKIIVLTADAIKGTRDKLISSGFDEYLGKPINIPQMERLFHRFIPEEQITYEEQLSEETNITEKQDTATSTEQNTADYRLNYLKKKLIGVDVDNGIENCGGQIDDYLQILKITYDYGEKQLNDLKEAWKNQDYKDYIIKIHSVKSTSKSIGAFDISEDARMQEEQGRAGNYTYIDEHMQSFQDNYTKLLRALYLVLEHFELLNTEDDSTDNIALDDNSVRYMLQNIERCIDEFDFAKVFDTIEESKKYQISDEYRSVLDEIERLMDDLSVDEIKALIQEKSPCS